MSFYLLGVLVGLFVWATLGWRLIGGEWIWQSHLTKKCTCGTVLDGPDDLCPGARMGRGPKVAR